MHISIEEMMEFVAGYVEEKVLGELLKSVKEAMRKKKKLETTLKSIESTLSSIIPVVQSINELNEKLDREDEDIGRLWKQIKEGQELVSKCSKGNCCGSCFKPSNCTEELRDFDNSLKRFYDFILPLKGTKILIDTREDVNEIKEKANRIDEKLGVTRDKVKEIKDMAKIINEKVEVTSDEAKGIHKEAKEIKGKANSIDEKVEATRFEVKGIKDKAEGIDEKVQVTRDDVKVMHQEVIDIKDKENRIDEKMENIHKEIQCLKIPASFPLYLPPEPPAIIVGLDKQLKDLKTELLKNEFSVVVITALGGCGKKTLAKNLCHEEDIKGKS